MVHRGMIFGLKNMKIKNTTLKIVKADITELQIDAIVNAANNELKMGGGVAGAIREKGGELIEMDAMGKGPIKVGETIWSQAGSLNSTYVLHAATMGMDFKTDQDKIRKAAASALICANNLKIESVAFPALGCGVGGFPLVGAAKIMTQEVMKFLKTHSTSLKEIVFCLYSEEAYQTFNDTVTGYVKYIQEELGPGPYVTVDIIIEVEHGIVLIERSNPPYGWAFPGGFLDYGETVEIAAIREAKEETNLDLINVRQLKTYSDPSRDPRFHTISTVFIAQGEGIPQAGDDAQNFKIVRYEDLLKMEYAFDHKDIIKDYLKDRA